MEAAIFHCFYHLNILFDHCFFGDWNNLMKFLREADLRMFRSDLMLNAILVFSVESEIYSQKKSIIENKSYWRTLECKYKTDRSKTVSFIFKCKTCSSNVVLCQNFIRYFHEKQLYLNIHYFQKYMFDYSQDLLILKEHKRV